jgi:hypothetical protein
LGGSTAKLQNFVITNMDAIAKKQYPLDEFTAHMKMVLTRMLDVMALQSLSLFKEFDFKQVLATLVVYEEVDTGEPAAVRNCSVGVFAGWTHSYC